MDILFGYGKSFYASFAKMDLSGIKGIFPKYVDEFVVQYPIAIAVFTVVAGIILGVVFFYVAQMVGEKPTPVNVTSVLLPDEEDEACEEAFRALRGAFDSNTIGRLRRFGQIPKEDPDASGDFYTPSMLTDGMKYYFDENGKCINKVTEIDSEDDSDLENTVKGDSEDGDQSDGKDRKKKKKVLFKDSQQVELGAQQMKDRDLLGKIGELHGKLKTAEIRAKTKQMEKAMSQQQRDEEARMRAEQLESIFKLMVQDQAKFGVSNKEDLDEQLKLYSL